jgi:O-antigen/teichoic acid export membrane protein
MRRRAIVAILSIWLAVTASGAYFYVIRRITSANAEPGYETTWSFQLFAFSLVRLPFYVAGLALFLWLTRSWWRKPNT